MLLADGAEVRIPRGYDVDPKLQAGDVVHVDAIPHAMADGTLYFRPIVKKGLDVIVDASGKPQQAAQPGAKIKLQPMKVTGPVAGFLLDGAGRHVGVVLADGTEAWVHGHADLAELGVKKGETLIVQGPGGAYAAGTAMFAKKLTLADGKVVEVPSPKWKGAADKK
ncbi:MAG: hypothetical protein NVSMB47_08210 [Polyangiales bacterium]